MKKIITTIISLTLFIVAYCQPLKYKVSEVKRLNYDEYTSEWETIDSTFPSEMYAFFNNTRIKVTDKLNSSYVVYGSPEKKTMPNYATAKWSAIDESQRDCIVMLQVVNPDDEEYKKTFLYIVYNTVTLMYIIDPAE